MLNWVVPRHRFVAFTVTAVGAVGADRFSSAVAQDATPVAAEVITLGWTDELSDGNGRLKVVTIVAPLSSSARNVGGTRIDLYGIDPDDTTSHTFAPAPSEARILSRADVVFVNDLGREEPAIRLAGANLHEGAAVVASATSLDYSRRSPVARRAHRC